MFAISNAQIQSAAKIILVIGCVIGAIGIAIVLYSRFVAKSGADRPEQRQRPVTLQIIVAAILAAAVIFGSFGFVLVREIVKAINAVEQPDERARNSPEQVGP